MSRPAIDSVAIMLARVQWKGRQTPTAQRKRNARLSSVLETDGSPGTPGLDNSEITEDTTFSALAKGDKGGRRSMDSPNERRRVPTVTLRDRSWAALTSGVADAGFASR